jgi:uncharacterized protein YegJ (DUF2314 family)
MGLWSWLKTLFANRHTLPGARRGGQRERLVALVLLVRDPRPLNAARLAYLAGEAFGDTFTDSGDHSVAGEPPSFVLKHDDRFFMVNCFDQPYMEDPEEAADAITELRLRKAVRDHSAWLSVDLLGECSDNELRDVYRAIGKLTAALTDDDTLALFSPGTSQLVVFDPPMRDQLRGDDPLALFDLPPHPPVVPVSGDDPRLKAAVAKARRRWQQFVTAFEERRPDQTFSVKARIGDSDCYEFMWLTVTGLENGIIYGRLDNDPVELTTIRCGDRVRVPVKELNDWLYTDGDDMHGGFSIEVLRKIQEEMQQE